MVGIPHPDPERTERDIGTCREHRPVTDLALIRREDGAQTVRFRDHWTGVMCQDHGSWQLLTNTGCWVESWDTRVSGMMPILQICFDYSGNEENA